MNRREALMKAGGVLATGLAALFLPGQAQGSPSSLEERWHSPCQDEDIWIPIRPPFTMSENRVFTIDLGHLPPAKAEAFINRLKEQFRKKRRSL